MERLINDVRLALRGLRRSPAFTIVVVLTLGLGIGVNSALYTVVQAVLLRPLPYPAPDRLVRAYSAWPQQGNWTGTVSPDDLKDWRERTTAFEHIAAYPGLGLSDMVRTGGEQPEALQTTLVTEEFFETLGVQPLLGRTLEAADQQEGRNRVVVLGYGFWKTRLGGAPDAVGSQLKLNGESYTVAGVMPQGFSYPDPSSQMWAPLSLIPESGVPRLRQVRWLSVVGRLKPGFTVQQAQTQLATLAATLETGTRRATKASAPRRCGLSTTKWSGRCGRACWACSRPSGWSC